MEAALVIKVKHGDFLRRFNAYFLPGMDQFDLDIDILRERISILFNFPPDADLKMTYVDEDGDVVSLVEDDDLFDAIRQELKCLKIDVRLSNEKQPSGNSTPPSSPRTENCVPDIYAVLAEILKPLPEPVREEFSKHYNDLSSKAPLSNSLMAAIVKSVVHRVDSYRNSDPQPPTGVPFESPMPPSVMNSQNTQVNAGNLTEIPVNNAKVMSARAPVLVDPNDHPNCRKESEGLMPNLKPSAYNTNSCMKEETGKEKDKETTPWYLKGLYERDAEQEHPNLCPCSGVPVAGFFPFWPISCSQCADLNTVLHRGFSCHGCGVDSMTGQCLSRLDDFDLCSLCFEKTVNTADFVQAIRPKLDSRFIMDVNTLERTTVAPGTPLTKICRMRNTGSVDWPEGTQFQWIGGCDFGCGRSVKIECLPVDEEVDVALDVFAPGCPGRYISYWSMATPSGQRFGHCVWVLVQVETSLGRTPSASFQDLNLNLPPKCEPGFPIDETLLVGRSFPSPTIPTAPVSSPAVSVVRGDQKLSVPSAQETAHIPPYTTVDLERNLLEERKTVQLERADLEQSFDDELCGMSEWDPILEELEEMGFCDQKMNKKLLLKNNGSMKHVVMDLISGQKAAME